MTLHVLKARTTGIKVIECLCPRRSLGYLLLRTCFLNSDHKCIKTLVNSDLDSIWAFVNSDLKSTLPLVSSDLKSILLFVRFGPYFTRSELAKKKRDKVRIGQVRTVQGRMVSIPSQTFQSFISFNEGLSELFTATINIMRLFWTCMIIANIIQISSLTIAGARFDTEIDIKNIIFMFYAIEKCELYNAREVTQFFEKCYSAWSLLVVVWLTRNGKFLSKTAYLKWFKGILCIF